MQETRTKRPKRLYQPVEAYDWSKVSLPAPAISLPELLEAFEPIGITRANVLRFRAEGKFPLPHRESPGGDTRFLRADIEAFLARMREARK